MTKERVVRGFISDGETIETSRITIRLTKDKAGQSLSLSDDKTIMLGIPLESVHDLIRLTDWRNND